MTDAMAGPLPMVPYVISETPSAAPDVTTTGSDLAKLSFKGTLLTIVTLGIYRFWFKTNLRRWYWRNTQVGGHAFEYRGTGKELFIGFLMAIAILTPLYLIGYFVTIIPSPQAQVMVSVTLGTIYLFIAQYGVFRGRRYRLTRTLWRGLRFDLAGSAWSYAFKSFGWLLLSVVTLGLTLPVARRHLEALKIRATRFGSAEGAFQAPVVHLIKRWLAIYVLVIGGFCLSAFLLFRPERGIISNAFLMVSLVLAAIAAFAALWPWYKSAEVRTFTNGTQFGPVSFTSRLPTGGVYWIYLKFGLAVLGIAGVVLAVLYGSRNLGSYGGVFNPLPLIVTLVYFGAFVSLAVLKEVMVNQQLWRLTAATLTVHNLAAVDDVIGSAVALDSATGEGFADAIDFGGV
jgi:uncharacterized membrane protein YjgN (DUF898 family)